MQSLSHVVHGTHSQNSSTGAVVLLWPSMAVKFAFSNLFSVMFSDPLKQAFVFHHPSALENCLARLGGVFKSAQWSLKAKFWLSLSLIFRGGGAVTTCGPGKAGQGWIGGEEVEEGPGNDHTVVDVQEPHYCHCGNPNTWGFRSSSMWFRRIYLWALGIVEPLTSCRLNQGTVQWPPREHLLSKIIVVILLRTSWKNIGIPQKVIAVK